MADFDLIPRAYARSGMLQARLRRCAIGLALVAAAVALGRAGLEVLIARENAEVARLRSLGQSSAQEQGKADAYRKQKLATEKQLAELDELRGRERLRLLLQAIDNAYLASIWFDEIRFFRRDTVASGAPGAVAEGARAASAAAPRESAPAPGTASRGPRVEQHVELAGHALSHTQLAEFMHGLGKQPGVADVRLVDTGLRSYTQALVVDMKLALLIDEKAHRPK